MRALLVTRTGEPECTKLFTVRPATVNWFVRALESVPHLIDTPVIEASTGNGHFNETERTPAEAVSEPGLSGFAAISTMPLPHNFPCSSSHDSFANGRTDFLLVSIEMSSSGFAFGCKADKRASAAVTCAADIDVPCR